MIDPEMVALAGQALAAARRDGVMVATAESCTGGLVAAALTAIAGSSDVVDRGFVTYSNDAKRQLLGVPEATLEACGAVSEATAIAMAEGALAMSRAGIAVSITGIAGPGGGSADKPVGLVWFGLARTGRDTAAFRHVFPADAGRDGIRRLAVHEALRLLAGAG